MRVDILAPDPGQPGGPEERILASRGELAQLMGQSAATIGKWASVEGMPTRAHGVYDVQECVQWRLRRLEQRLDQARKTKGEESTSRKRRESAEASLKELELARRRGELVEAQASGAFARRIAQIVAGHLAGVAPRISKRVVAAEGLEAVQVLISDDIDILRSSIADALVAAFGGDGGGPDHPAGADA